MVNKMIELIFKNNQNLCIFPKVNNIIFNPMLVEFNNKPILLTLGEYPNCINFEEDYTVIYEDLKITMMKVIK